MLSLTIAALIITLATITRLVSVVRNDRPLSAPRSHPDDLAPFPGRSTAF